MVAIYDTTLRDGAQREGISFSVEDKLRIARKIDELGIHFIEGGWPGSNPKDMEFLRRVRGEDLSAKIVPFGSTRRPGRRAEDDPSLLAIKELGFEYAAIVGKAWDLHVTEILGTELDENLRMIEDSIKFLRRFGIKVFFDAEHFFDGFKENPSYALKVVEVAAESGADVVVLCDTNGGSLPDLIREGVLEAKKIGVPLGIHAHNDSELAVANSIEAVKCGVVQVQGTINGYGERCGNTNLCSLIPNLVLKLGIECIPREKLKKLTEVSRYVSELANLPPDSHLPYVGSSAFTHKAGLHISAILKEERSYQHVDPEAVGNRRRIVISELSGKSAIMYKAKELGIEFEKSPEEILEKIKSLEKDGFQFEDAEASFELLLRRSSPSYKPPFELIDFMVLVEKRRRPSIHGSEVLAEAMVKVKVGDRVIHTASEGNGPVHALDMALRKALTEFYPGISKIKLLDYKVRILEEGRGTDSWVRVLIESTDGKEEWRTVGSSSNIIEASWIALADSFEYWLLKEGGYGEDNGEEVNGER